MRAFYARYGGPCLICGVARDYHGLTPKDHAFIEPQPRCTSCIDSAEKPHTHQPPHGPFEREPYPEGATK